MEKSRTVEEIEKKVVASNFIDGFIDMMATAIFLQFALYVWVSRFGNDELWAYAIVSGAFFLTFGGTILIRKYVSEPRLGFVQFKKERKKKIGALFLMSTVILISGIVMSFILPRESWLPTVLMISLVLLVLFMIAAFVFHINRIYLYGILAAMAVPFGKWADIISGSRYGLPLTMLAVGFLMFLSSIVVFIRFLRNYPKRQNGE